MALEKIEATIVTEVDNDSLKQAEKDIKIFARDTGEELDKATIRKLELDTANAKIKAEKLADDLRQLKKLEKLELELATATSTSEINKIQWKIDKLHVTAEDRVELEIKTTKAKKEATELNRQYNNLLNTWEKTTSRLQKKFDALWSWMSKSFSKIWTAATAMFTAIWWTALISNILWSSGELEQTRTAFNLLIWDTEQAWIVLNDLADFSSKTPFKFPEITDWARKLSSVAWVAKEELIPVLTSLWDIAASQWKGIDQTVEAFNDAITWEFERLKEFGIKASSNGDDVTFTFKEQETTVKKTKWAIQDYLIWLSEAQWISWAMEEQSKTLNWRISTLKDNFWFLVKSIVWVKANWDIIEWWVVDKVWKFASYVWDIVTRYKEWGEENPKLAAAIWIVAVWLGVLAAAIGAVWVASTLLLPWLTAIWATLAPFAIPIAWIVVGLTALWLAYKNNLGGFADTVKELLSKITPVFNAITKTLTTFVKFLNDKFWDEIKSLITGTWEVILWVFTFIWNVISGARILMGNESSKIWWSLRGLWASFNAVWQVVKVVFQQIGNVIELTLWTVSWLFSVFWNLLKWDVNWAFQWVINIVKSFWTFFENFWVDTLNWAVSIISGFVPSLEEYWKNLIVSFVAWMKSWFKDLVWDYLWIASPTKKWPLSLDQSIWWKNLIKAVAKGIKSESPSIKKEVESIAKEMSELWELQLKYRTKASVSNQSSKLDTKLNNLDFWSADFNETQRQIRLLWDLQSKYNGDETSQEERLLELAKEEKELADEMLDIQDEKKEKQLENMEYIQEWLEKELDRAEELLEFSDKRIESMEELRGIIWDINDLEKDTNKTLAERSVDIDSERGKLLESFAWDWNFNAINSDIATIDEKLAGVLSEKKRIDLEEKRLVLLEKLEKKIKNQNSLSWEAYDIKQKLLELDEEQDFIAWKWVSSETIDEVKAEWGLSESERIIAEAEIWIKAEFLEKELSLEEEQKQKLQSIKKDYEEQIKITEGHITEIMKTESDKQNAFIDKQMDKIRELIALRAEAGLAIPVQNNQSSTVDNSRSETKNYITVPVTVKEEVNMDNVWAYISNKISLANNWIK